jgi:hypothetical protein
LGEKGKIARKPVFTQHFFICPLLSPTMKNALFISLLACSLLLAACAQTATTPSTPTPNVDAPKEDLTQPTAVTDSKSVTLDPFLPSELRATAEKGVDRINTGYGYTYTKLENNKLSSETANQLKIAQRGAIRKVDFYKNIQLDATFFMKGIILNTDTQTAMAYCVDTRCSGDKGTPAQRSMTYSDFNFVTPTDWLVAMRGVKIVGQEQLGGRASTKVTAKVNDIDTTLWIDTYSGIPLQAEQSTTRYTYTNLVLGVKDSELTP